MRSMSDLARLLRRTRQEAQLTQAQLAQRVGIDQQTVSRWERGTSTPAKDILSRIARVFGEPDENWVGVAGEETEYVVPGLALPVRPLLDRLPLEDLAPSDFERFTSCLLEVCYPNATIARVGGHGHVQGGADVLVRTSDGLHLFQCKRVKRFGPAQMKQAAQAAATSMAEKRVLVLSRVASQAARDAARSVGWDIWDHDDIVRMLQQKVNPDSARRVIKIFFPGWEEDFLGIRGGGPWELPDEFFAGQREESPFSHGYELVGREDELAKVLEWAHGNSPFFLLTGAAGVGKSRFLLEAAHRIACAAGRPAVYFVDKTAIVDLEDFRKLGDSSLFIVVDDAHDRDDTELIIRGAGTQFGVQRRARVLFATREYGKARLVRALAEHAGELETPTAHLVPLMASDARRLAALVLGAPETSPFTTRLVAVAGDCTLFLVAAGYLLKTKDVDPAFLDDEEGFRIAVLERMYSDYVTGTGHLPGDVSVADLLQLLASVHPFDLDDTDALEAAGCVLGCRRDVLTSALGQIVRTGVVVKRRSRLRVQPDLLADHILVRACFDRTLGKATGYADRVWQDSTAGLRRNLIVNIARIDWRLSESGMSPESMLTEAWHVLDREFRVSGIAQRLDLLELLEKVAFYQPERTLNLVEWALDHELPSEHTPVIEYTYDEVRVRVAPVLRVCAYHLKWLYQSCELLRRLAQTDLRQTNPHPEHPLRILCDLAAYSRYKPFDHTQRVIRQAIEWLRQDKAQFVFDILDHALRQEFDDHISDGHSVTFYPDSALVLGRERVLSLRDEVLGAVSEQLGDDDVSLAVRAAKSLKLALALPGGLFGRKPDADEMTVWEAESVRLLKRIRLQLDGARLSPSVAVALRDAVEPARRGKIKALAAAAEEVLDTMSDDLVYQVVEVLVHGPWRWNRRHGPDQEPSSNEAQRWLKDLARRFLEDSIETATAVGRVEQHLVEIGTSSNALGVGNFVAALIKQRPCIGVQIVGHVIADSDSPLTQVIGVTVSAVRVTDVEQALKLAQALLNTGSTAVRLGVANAYGWGLASAPTVLSAELTLIRELAADDDVRMALQLCSGLHFVAEKDPRQALSVILRMRIGRSEQLAGEVLGLFRDTGPLRIDDLDQGELEHIVEELVGCDQIDDYWIQEFLASWSRIDLRSVVRLLQRRVEHAETLEESKEYRPVPFDWHDKWHLESIGARERLRVLQELRDWAAADVPGWRRRYEAPRLFAAAASVFDDEALGVIEIGLKAPVAIASKVATLLSAVPRDFAWSRVKWIVRTLEDAASRTPELYKGLGGALHAAVMSGVRMGSPGEPFPEDVEQRDEARKVADGLPPGSPGERFYRSIQRVAEYEIERELDDD